MSRQSRLEHLVCVIQDQRRPAFRIRRGFSCRRDGFQRRSRSPMPFLSTELVELSDMMSEAFILTPSTVNGNALLKIRSQRTPACRAPPPAKRSSSRKSGFVVLRLVFRVFKVQPLVGQMPEVFILGIVRLPADLQRDVMRLCVIDLLVAAFDMLHSRHGAMIFISGAKALIVSSKRT